MTKKKREAKKKAKKGIIALMREHKRLKQAKTKRKKGAAKELATFEHKYRHQLQ